MSGLYQQAFLDALEQGELIQPDEATLEALQQLNYGVGSDATPMPEGAPLESWPDAHR